MTHSFSAVVSQHSFGLCKTDTTAGKCMVVRLRPIYYGICSNWHINRCSKVNMISSVIFPYGLSKRISTEQREKKHHWSISWWSFWTNDFFIRTWHSTDYIKCFFFFIFCTLSLLIFSSVCLTILSLTIHPIEFPNGNDLTTIATCNRNVIYAFSWCFDGFFCPHNMIIANYIRCLIFNDEGDYIYFVHWPHRSIYIHVSDMYYIHLSGIQRENCDKTQWHLHNILVWMVFVFIKWLSLIEWQRNGNLLLLSNKCDKYVRRKFVFGLTICKQWFGIVWFSYR